jgi:hypothetical protein
VRATALLVAVAAATPLLTPACGGGRGDAPGAIPGLDVLTAEGESVLFARRFHLGPPGADNDPQALVAVVLMSDGHEEMRVAEPAKDGFKRVFSTRPGDEFRNLAIEDLNGDGRPEIVGRWTGGQLEVIEVDGRAPQGGWRSLLQNAGQTIEERRRSDRTVAFWITSRTYEEEAGLPPVYVTRVWRWDGSGFTEEPH